ncbi:hypothetical protein ACHAWT_000922 [Skeletonema menzelii]
MKMILAIASLCIATKVVAFSTSPPAARIIVPSRAVLHHFHLHGTLRPDASEAIAEALKISEELGATSNEARVAWDNVEEMDSNDSSPAFLGSNTIGVDTLSDDYYGKIRSLHYLMEDTNWSMQQMKRLIKEIKLLDLKDPSLARLPDGEGGAALKAALSDAKAAVEVHGASSVEAKKAWDKLDSCFGSNAEGALEFSDECDIDSKPSSYRYSAAALKAHHLYNAAIDTELLDEALDALGMLKGLTKFVNIEKRRLDAGVSVDFADSD